MYHLKSVYIFLFFCLTPLMVLATTYENASDKKTDGWHILKQFSKGVVKNIYDKKKRSRVIKLEGNATRTVYMLRPKKKIFKRKKEENILEWEMKYNEDFVIIIGVNTIKGERFIIYTSGDKSSYLQYGLGVDSRFGQWKKYRRDLQKDLERYDRYNEFLTINSFVIKGSGLVDNIKMVKLKEALPKSSTVSKSSSTMSKLSSQKNSIVSKKLLNKSIKEDKYIESNQNSTPPVIHIIGKNPMILKKGEAYIEAGATAKNRDGSLVRVTISDDIDILKEGEYSVIYMATNNAGHSVIDRRRVIVGKIMKEKKVKESEKSEEVEEREDLDEEIIDLEQRALEMLEWEKELAFREKELLENKNRREVKPPEGNYPSRPGL